MLHKVLRCMQYQAKHEAHNRKFAITDTLPLTKPEAACCITTYCNIILIYLQISQLEVLRSKEMVLIEALKQEAYLQCFLDEDGDSRLVAADLLRELES